MPMHLEAHESPSMRTERPLLLIVDDSIEEREAIAEMLAAHGFRVTLASDGEDALRRLRSGLRPSLILLDVDMPYLDGGGFLQRAQAEARLADIPVVIVSGTKFETAAFPGLPALRKPIGVSQTLALVHRALARSRDR